MELRPVNKSKIHPDHVALVAACLEEGRTALDTLRVLRAETGEDLQACGLIRVHCLRHLRVQGHPQALALTDIAGERYAD